MFLKYDGKTCNAKEHVRGFVDALTVHSHDHDLRMKDFSKSLEGCTFSWYASLALGSVFGWSDLSTRFMKKFFAVDERVTVVDLGREKQRLGEELLDCIRRYRGISLSCSRGSPTGRPLHCRDAIRIQALTGEPPDYEFCQAYKGRGQFTQLKSPLKELLGLL